MEKIIEIGLIPVLFKSNHELFDEIIEKNFKNFVSNKSPLININIIYQKGVQIDETEDHKIFANIENDEVIFKTNSNIEGNYNFINHNGTFYCDDFQIGIDFILRVVIIYSFPFFDSILIHSSASFDENIAIMGTGLSGAGKTTLAQILEKQNFTIIHDDVNLIRKIDDDFYIFPTHISSGNINPFIYFDSKKLNNLFIIAKNNDNFIENLSKKDIFLNLPKFIFSYSAISQKHYEKYFEIMEHLSKYVKKLHFNKETLNIFDVL